MRFLISGASGFVGKLLCEEAMNRGYATRAVIRSRKTSVDNIELVLIPSISGETDWTNALHDIDVVIHLAARVHVMQDNASDPLEEFRKVNVAGTEHLARSAASQGVKRLVYVSSIKVNGESTVPIPTPTLTLPLNGRVQYEFSELDDPDPQDPYGISKYEAEQALHRVSEETGLEVVIVRPPLVYGEEVKANFAQMLAVLAKGIPLPLASVKNLRSFVYVGNLVDALILCATHPTAAGQTYLVSDGEDISTPNLLRQLGASMGRTARLFPCPPALLKLASHLIGKSGQIERLLGSLQVDGGKIRRELNWTPPYTMQQGLQKTAEWYRNTHL